MIWRVQRLGRTRSRKTAKDDSSATSSVAAVVPYCTSRSTSPSLRRHPHSTTFKFLLRSYLVLVLLVSAGLVLVDRWVHPEKDVWRAINYTERTNGDGIDRMVASSSSGAASSITAASAAAAAVDYQEQRRQAILSVCGDLCDLKRPVGPPQFGYFGATTSHVDCRSLLSSSVLDEPGDNQKPPKTIPAVFQDDYRMPGHANVEDWYIKDVYAGKKAKQSVWTKKLIEEYKQKALAGEFDSFGNYDFIDRKTLYETLINVTRIENQSVLVVGSETPWVEALCLAAGARHVTTLEYGSITSEHPAVTAYTPQAFRQAYLDGKLGTFDAVVSYSSVEHSGLGRYGDALNPWGDIMTIARAWCVTAAGGSLTLGAPSGPIDTVYWNAGRVYSWNRWPYLVTNWARLDFSAGWYEHPELWNAEDRKPLPKRLQGPPGYGIYRNQSSLVFRKVEPEESVVVT